MNDPITEAVERAATEGAPPKVWHVGPDAVIQLAEDGSGHLLTDATITHWTVD
ncbi:hypothetical protein [Mycolicibacterium komossense]|uniref:Uncharacterized protein n=1 Tax=Mycolicibacterium komossense TaxID=1779 RepID=A0ABT3CN15_9MYCO|nr:hypothetical protein [Mycolicibacterium komossense]MCV7230865.1 hypothetical protein [Mycolicibacterium komossense]